MIGEVVSLTTVFWKIKDFLSTAYASSARCIRLRDCLDHQMPLFRSAIESLDAQSPLMTHLDSFARSTLAFARKFEKRNFIWKLLLSPQDNAEFDRILAELDGLQRDISFAMLAELKEHTTRTIEAAVSILTSELRRVLAGAHLTDLKFDQQLLLEPPRELPPLTASDVVDIRANVTALRESCAEISPDIVSLCDFVAGNVLPQLDIRIARQETGVIDGFGTYKYADGTVYVGEWKDDVKSGEGKEMYPDGTVYDGEWKGNVKNGNGKEMYADGDVYDGEWKDGVKSGKGKETYPDCAVYDGEWEGNVKNGKGKEMYANGDVYDGEWKDSIKSGNGKYMFASGIVYDGEWKDGEFMG